MSRSRRKTQPNLPFTAAFALIQMLREPGQRSRESFAAEANESALTKGRSYLPYAPFETDYLRADASGPLTKPLSGRSGLDCGGEHL